ncbi:hypothetical protein [Chlorogloeopsis fritschii]|nr:hypothetical protein [Chlorogloeopsis fritschii]
MTKYLYKPARQLTPVATTRGTRRQVLYAGEPVYRSGSPTNH